MIMKHKLAVHRTILFNNTLKRHNHFSLFTFCLFLLGIRQCAGRRVRYYLRKSRARNSSGTSSSGKISCRSRRTVSNMVCSSSCSTNLPTMRRAIFGQSDAVTSYCCQAIRSVSKPIRMTCDDGSVYRQTMQRIRRCACQPCT